jgi:hypothetical protein
MPQYAPAGENRDNTNIHWIARHPVRAAGHQRLRRIAVATSHRPRWSPLDVRAIAAPGAGARGPLEFKVAVNELQLELELADLPILGAAYQLQLVRADKDARLESAHACPVMKRHAVAANGRLPALDVGLKIADLMVYVVQ